MGDHNGYAVFFFPPALEALGEAIKPYLVEGEAGAQVVCRGIDTGGSLIKMILDGRTSAGELTELELMVPGSMVRMIVSTRTDEAFGFGPRITAPVAVPGPAADAGHESPVTPDTVHKDKAAGDTKTATTSSAESPESPETGEAAPEKPA